MRRSSGVYIRVVMSPNQSFTDVNIISLRVLPQIRLRPCFPFIIGPTSLRTAGWVTVLHSSWSVTRWTLSMLQEKICGGTPAQLNGGNETHVRLWTASHGSIFHTYSFQRSYIVEPNINSVKCIRSRDFIIPCDICGDSTEVPMSNSRGGYLVFYLQDVPRERLVWDYLHRFPRYYPLPPRPPR